MVAPGQLLCLICPSYLLQAACNNSCQAHLLCCVSKEPHWTAKLTRHHCANTAAIVHLLDALGPACLCSSGPRAGTLYSIKQHCTPLRSMGQAVDALVQARLPSHSPPEFCNAVSSGACCVPTLSLALLHECQVWPAVVLGCIHSALQGEAIRSGLLPCCDVLL